MFVAAGRYFVDVCGRRFSLFAVVSLLLFLLPSHVGVFNGIYARLCVGVDPSRASERVGCETRYLVDAENDIKASFSLSINVARCSGFRYCFAQEYTEPTSRPDVVLAALPTDCDHQRADDGTPCVCNLSSSTRMR